jgi:carboxylesterase type B
LKDLLDEAKANNEPPSNFGLHDQRNSFLWVKRFISGFGGNPFHVTAFGESAGSGSIALQMCSDVPLFNRAMLQSATTATGPPVELKYKEAEYEALLRYCGIGLDDPKRLQRLREVPVSKLIEAIDGIFIPLFNSLRHESFFPRGYPTWWTEDELIGNCEWVDEVVIGDAFYEGWLLADALKHIPLDGFIQLSNTTLGIENAKKILSAYDITPEMDSNLFWTKLNFLIGDVAFSDPTHKLANSLATQKGPNRKKVYRYHLTVRNPFPGSSYYQIPGHHFVDMLFLFGTLKFRYPLQNQRDLSDEFGKRWLNFGNGLEPWEEYKLDGTEDEGKIMIIGGSEGWSLKSRKQDERESKVVEEGERRYKGWEAIADVMRKLAEVDSGFVKENARLAWGPDGGIYRLLGVQGPYGVVRP